MKLIKQANNKFTLSLTQEEWEKMGNDNGWLFTEAKKKKKYKKSPMEHGFIEECEKKNQDKKSPGGYCVLPETLILGDNKRICDYEMGNSVIGKDGLQSVLTTFSREFKGDIFKIKASNLFPIFATGEHSIFSVRSISKNEHIKGFTDGEWIEAKNLIIKEPKIDGNYLVVPRLKGQISTKKLSLLKYIKNNKNGFITLGKKLDFPLNENTAWALGLYVAEGSASNGVSSKEVCVSLNHNETELQEKFSKIISSLGYKTRIRKRKTATTVGFSSGVLGRAFKDWCGQGAKNKKIPEFILLHKNIKILKAFIDGYIEGDGCIYKKGITMSSISKLLIIQLQLAFASIGIFSSASEQNRGDSCIIQGRKVNRNKVYTLVIFKNNNKIKDINKKRMNENYLFFPIRSIEKIKYNGIVNNIETNDNTYLVNNAILHNCASIVDKVKGSTKWRKVPKKSK